MQTCNFAVLYFCLFRSRTSAPSEINGHQSGCIGTKAHEPDMLGYQKTGLTPSLLKQLVLCFLCLTYTLKVHFHNIRTSVCGSASVIHTFSLSILFCIIVSINPDQYTDLDPCLHPKNRIAIGSEFLRT